MTEAGVLVLAGAPIGDPSDAWPRLARELAAADVVAAEDTRRCCGGSRPTWASPSRGASCGVPRVQRGRADPGPRRRPAGRSPGAADTGMPSVSDPGYRRG